MSLFLFLFPLAERPAQRVRVPRNKRKRIQESRLPNTHGYNTRQSTTCYAPNMQNDQPGARAKHTYFRGKRQDMYVCAQRSVVCIDRRLPSGHRVTVITHHICLRNHRRSTRSICRRGTDVGQRVKIGRCHSVIKQVCLRPNMCSGPTYGNEARGHGGTTAAINVRAPTYTSREMSMSKLYSYM